MAAEGKKTSNTGRIIIVIVGILLLTATAFFAYQWLNEKGKNNEAVDNIEELNTEIVDLETDLKDLESELDDADLEIEEKDRLIAEKEEELILKQKRIDQLLKSNKISKAQAEELSAKIEQLEYYIEKYQKQVEDLKFELGIVKEENEGLRGRVDTLENTTHELEMDNIRKTTIIESAAVLQAAEFKFSRVKNSGKEVPGTEFSNGRLENLKVQFKLMKNSAAESGSRDLYIAIKTPSGKIEQNKQSGSFTYEGGSKKYTLKTTVSYDNFSGKLVKVNYIRPEKTKYEEGKHIVTVYCDNFEIGHAHFNTK